MLASLNDVFLWLVVGVYGVYGLFSLFAAYNILIRRNIKFVTGFDERYLRNLKNEDKFIRDYAMPHILIGLSCVGGVLGVFVFGISSMLISVALTLVLFGYATSITRRMPERVRRGRYM